MKKHLPLLILTLFLGAYAQNTGVVFQLPVLPEDGIKHTLIDSWGYLYDGVITEGTKEKGKGIFIGQSKNVEWARGWYEGEFVGDKTHGQGTYSGPNGLSYVGEWENSQTNGMGTATYADGSKYVGEFKDGKRHGQGTLTYANGEKYVGEFKDSKYDGKGVLYKVNGEIQSGTWTDGNFQKTWTIDAVSRFLKNKYPQFTGFDSETSATIETAVKSFGASISGFIAVLEFEGNNISSGEVRALTDRLRSELVGTGQLTIIERGKMEEVLKEQSFQQTGCVSSECAVEVGKLLGVEQIVTGNISKVGTFFSVTARVVSVQSGEIVRSTIYDHSGDIGGLLTQGMRKVAEELGK